MTLNGVTALILLYYYYYKNRTRSTQLKKLANTITQCKKYKKEKNSTDNTQFKND